MTCLKVGKKLIWNKAAVNPVAKQSPAATPVTSVAPVAAVPTAPTSFDDLIQNYKGISYAAWSKSRAKILASTKTDFNYQLVLGPNSQLTNKDPTSAFNLVTRLYSGYAKPGDVYLLAFNFEDRDWAVKQMDSIIPTAGSAWIYDVACATKSTCFGGGSFTDSSNKHLMVLTVGLIDDNTTTGNLAFETCLAAMPNNEAKAYAFNKGLDAEVATSVRTALVAGFQRPIQRTLLEPFVNLYFDNLISVWESRSYEPAAKFVSGFYPTWIVKQSTVDATNAWLNGAGKDAPTVLRKLVKESQDGLIRALKVQALDK